MLLGQCARVEQELCGGRPAPSRGALGAATSEQHHHFLAAARTPRMFAATIDAISAMPAHGHPGSIGLCESRTDYCSGTRCVLGKWTRACVRGDRGQTLSHCSCLGGHWSHGTALAGPGLAWPVDRAPVWAGFAQTCHQFSQRSSLCMRARVLYAAKTA